MRAGLIGAVLAAGVFGCDTNNYYIVPDLSGLLPPVSTDMAAPPECTSGQKQCVGDKLVGVCSTDGHWFTLQCADAEMCVNGACEFNAEGASCTPGEGICVSATMLARCRATGKGFEM